MKCDTCKKEVQEVCRVMVYKGYDRTCAVAIYNCPDCYAQKEKTKDYTKESEPSKP